MADHVEVYVQIAGKDVLAGRLWTHRRRSAESQTFSYAPQYLARKDAYELDPLLTLPRPGRRELTTAIDLDAADAEPELLMSVAPYFRLSATEAGAILTQVEAATKSWRSTARELGASNAELEEMESAFEHEAARKTRQLLSAAQAGGRW